MAERRLTGWGRTAPAWSDVRLVASADDVVDAFEAAGDRGVIARGLGRSYGDAAQNSGGVVLDLAPLSSIDLRHDSTVRIGAGASLAAVVDALAPHGLFLPVTPGTSRVTVGGALAADVHGKNHHREGSFGDHVVEVEVVTPGGGISRVGPASVGAERDLFRALVGGMGLVGVVTEVVLRPLAVPSVDVVVDTTRLDDLDSVMGLMAATDDRYRYSVAWIDATARGASLGRGIVTQADHAPDPAPVVAALDRPARISVPFVPPVGLVGVGSVRAFNELWFRKAPRLRVGERQDVRRFFHPLDGVEGWNRAYGPHGLVQHQCVLPEEASGTVRLLLELFQARGAASFLTVLKRFGPGNDSPLSFPRAGWTLAVDLPGSSPDLARTLDAADDLVLGSGGRAYLAKDSRLSPAALRTMYPRLDHWLEVRSRVDPDRTLVSDLSRRLSL